MHPEVRAAFVRVNTPIEGVVPWMYVDRRGLVHSGMGNLLEPANRAKRVPWHHLAGERASGDATQPFRFRGPLATPAEIDAAWSKVKTAAMTDKGGFVQHTLTDLRLDDAGLDTLINEALLTHEATLRAFLPGWDDFPADAQLALLSMAYAMGPGFAAPGNSQFFPKFTAAIRAGDFALAAKHSTVQPDSDSALHHRNQMNRQLLLDAAKRKIEGGPLDKLTRDVRDLVAIASGKLASAGAYVREAASRAADASKQALLRVEKATEEKAHEMAETAEKDASLAIQSTRRWMTHGYSSRHKKETGILFGLGVLGLLALILRKGSR